MFFMMAMLLMLPLYATVVVTIMCIVFLASMLFVKRMQ